MRRHLPNIVTALRIAATALLGWLAAVHRQDAFAAILIACLVGDVVDGVLARALGAETTAGAQLDSIADTLLFFMAIVGVLVFHPEAVRAYAGAFTVVPAAWLAENVAALARYGRLSSFHTYLSRAAAVAMGLFIAVLFAWGIQPLLLYIAAALVLVATAEELVLLWMLPEWTANVRGVLWVRRRQV